MDDLGNKKIIARNIQYYMNKNNKTRMEMSEALGVKYTTFTDWVKGKSYPRIDKIEMIANYFGITKSDLVEDRDNYNNPVTVNQIIYTPLTVAAHLDIRDLSDAELEDVQEYIEFIRNKRKKHQNQD